MKCKHCEFIDRTFGEVLKCKDSTFREYWLMTEVFVYLHGKDSCNLDGTVSLSNSNPEIRKTK